MTSTSTPKCTPSRNCRITSRVVDLMDPRSPTTAFDRTPIQIILSTSNETDDKVTNPNDNDAQTSPISVASLSSDGAACKTIPEINETTSTTCSFMSACNDLSISCVDLTSRDVSAIVSDLSVCSVMPENPTDTTEIIMALGEQMEQVKLQNLKLDQAEESANLDLFDDSTCETKPLIKKPMKKLFYTPNKKRSPLVAVDNICPVTPSALGTPKNVLREKQWKRFQEERKKLGFESDENFQLPLYDVTASAPSKLMLRRQNVQSRHKFS